MDDKLKPNNKINHKPAKLNTNSHNENNTLAYANQYSPMVITPTANNNQNNFKIDP
jgi:hypothetical protein